MSGNNRSMKNPDDFVKNEEQGEKIKKTLVGEKIF